MSAEEELYELACQDMPVAGPDVRAAMDAWRKEIEEELELAARRTMASYLATEAARRVGAPPEPLSENLPPHDLVTVGILAAARWIDPDWKEEEST